MYNPQFQSQFVIPTSDLNEQIVQSHFLRQEEKKKAGKISHVISMQGSNGGQGRSGMEGNWGASGASGNWGGGHGYAGGVGGNGANAENGGFGAPGKNLHLVLVGNDPEFGIELHGSYETSVKIQGETYIAISTKGGDGGEGGNGGNGGGGGAGGAGGNGREGQRGRHAHHPGDNGANGGRGGDGGSGGQGGRGGNGGQAGNGGNGGNGGNVLLQTSNPSLFMCFEIDARGGVVGSGGQGGKGGPGGMGGAGGQGGPGGRGGRPGPPREEKVSLPEGGFRIKHHKGRRGWDGSRGNNGRGGANGSVGTSGRDGIPGQKGSNGRILYMVTNPEGTQVFEQGSSRYELVVKDFNVRGVFDDGIFEPGEEIIISDVQVTNSGSICLPRGSQIVFPATQTFMCNPSDHFELPAIKPGEAFSIPYTYRGRVMDVPEQTIAGRHSGNLQVTSSGNLLMRPFGGSVCTKTFPTCYPVRISGVSSPTQMGQREVFPIVFEVENISNVPYGSSSANNNVGVTLKIILQSGFMFHNEESGGSNSLPLQYSQVVEEEVEGESATAPPMTNAENTNPNEFFVDIPLLEPPGGERQARFRVSKQILFNPDVNFFDHGVVVCELRYKGKLIEKFERKVRCAPNFTQMLPEFRDSFDGLFITDQHINKTLFQAYTQVFCGLGLNMNIWDIERYRGLSIDTVTKKPHPISWVNQFQGKVIVSHLPKGNQFFFGTAFPHHLDGHFCRNVQEGPKEKKKKKMVEFESGWVVINPPSPEMMKTNFKKIFLEHVGEGNIPVDKNALQARYYLTNPKKEYLMKLLDDFYRNLRFKTPNLVFHIDSHKFDPKKLGWGKYQLGTATMRKMNFSRSSKFVMCGKELSIADGESLKNEKRKCFRRKFWMIMKAVICGLKLLDKLRLFNKACMAREMKWKFSVGGRATIGFDELIADCVYEDLKLDVRCDYNELTRSSKFLELIRNDFTILERAEVQKLVYIAILRVYYFTGRTKEPCKCAKKKIWKIVQGVEKQIGISKREKKDCDTLAKGYKETGAVEFGFVGM